MMFMGSTSAWAASYHVAKNRIRPLGSAAGPCASPPASCAIRELLKISRSSRGTALWRLLDTTPRRSGGDSAELATKTQLTPTKSFSCRQCCHRFAAGGSFARARDGVTLQTQRSSSDCVGSGRGQGRWCTHDADQPTQRRSDNRLYHGPCGHFAAACAIIPALNLLIPVSSRTRCQT